MGNGISCEEKEGGNIRRRKHQCKMSKKRRNLSLTQKVTAKNKHSSPLQDARLCDHLWNLSTLKAVESLGKFVLLVVTQER